MVGENITVSLDFSQTPGRTTNALLKTAVMVKLTPQKQYLYIIYNYVHYFIT